jgi:hypothetical protein
MIAIGAIVVLLWIAKEAIDMASRVDWVEQNLPQAVRWAESKRWQRILILVTAVMVAWMAYETWTEPGPPSAPSADAGAREAEIVQLKAQIKALSGIRQSAPTKPSVIFPRIPLSPENLHTLEGALLDVERTPENKEVITIFDIKEPSSDRSQEESFCGQLVQAFNRSPSWTVNTGSCVVFPDDYRWGDVTKYGPEGTIVIRGRVRDDGSDALSHGLKEIGFQPKIDMQKDNKNYKGKPVEGIELMIGHLKH